MSELDKTIEELEAAVSLELEEAKAPAVGKGDSMEKPEGEVEDLGKAVVEPDSTDSIGKKASAKSKKTAEPTAKATKEDAASDHEGDELEEAKSMTKTEMLKAMYSKMENMKASDLKAAFDAGCSLERVVGKLATQIHLILTIQLTPLLDTHALSAPSLRTD